MICCDLPALDQVTMSTTRELLPSYAGVGERLVDESRGVAATKRSMNAVICSQVIAMQAREVKATQGMHPFCTRHSERSRQRRVDTLYCMWRSDMLQTSALAVQ